MTSIRITLMRSLNLDQLRTFAEVLAQGSFSAAARALNLTQPAVSLQIRQLEARLSVRLIERFGKQAHATAPGQDLLDHARRIFAVPIQVSISSSPTCRPATAWSGCSRTPLISRWSPCR